MDKITITIATRNRLQKLLRCLESIPQEPQVEVMVCCDNDYETYEALKHHRQGERLANLIVTHDHLGSPACHNILASFVNDGLLYLMDDMTLYPNTLEVAQRSFNNLFPDDDGMLGLHQEGAAADSQSGVALLGKKFLERFPDKKFSFPGYWHFADMELIAYAQEINRFYFEPDAWVRHYHPDSGEEDRDSTHYEARKKKQEDFNLYQERQKSGELWGY